MRCRALPSYALVTFALAGCGAPSAQRASVTPVAVRARTGDTDAVPKESAAERLAEEEPGGEGPRWLITPNASHVEVHARSALAGSQDFEFTRFRVHARGTDVVTFRADVDTRTLDGGAAPARLPLGRDAMLAIVKSQLLEVDSFPRATFDGVARRTGTRDECHVKGVLRLHGAVREIELDGRVEEIGDALHFTAEATLPREAFDIRLRGPFAAWDAFVPDDVVVSLDLRARREKVTVEPVE